MVFALGSLITALAYDMPTMVAGRFLQGVGGGGLVPATLALVADLYPVERRGVPLGVVSAVQEIGSVLGPLFGALVLAVADWRAIFAINLAVGLVLAAAIRALRPAQPARPAASPSPCPTSSGCSCCWSTFVAGALVFLRPARLMRDLTWGQLFIPFAGDGRWLTPLGAGDRRRARPAAGVVLVRARARCSTCAAGSACSSRPTWSAPCCSPPRSAG